MTTNCRIAPGLIAGLTLILTACAGGDRTADRNRNEPATKTADNAAPTELRTVISNAEQDFLTKAAQGGLMEVELGRAAAERSQSDGLKELGRMLIEDHRAANKELMRLAVIKDVPLPTEPSEEQRAAINRIWDLKGGSFDREFLSHAQQHHQKDIQEFQRMASEAQDPQIRTFASNTLPTLQKHAERMQELMSKRR